MNGKHPIILTLLALIIAYPQYAQAYQFTPNEVEWQRWPGHCQAKYVWTNIGKNSQYSDRVSHQAKQQLVQWESAGISGLHHYCTGTIWLNRAMREKDSTQREYMLNNAYQETRFTYERSERSAPQYVYIATQFAMILYEQNKAERALQVLEETISAQPNNELAYSATAVVQRRLGYLTAAKNTLLQGHKALNGQSAEIHYNLGLIFLELGEVENAVVHAQRAYALGFPLQGLRVKLEKLGKM